MDAVELVVFGAAGWTRDWVTSILISAGFRVTWRDEVRGTAERGDRIDGWLLGSRSPWLRLDVHLLVGEDGRTAIRVDRLGPPATARRRWDTAMNDVKQRLETAFLETGTLASIGR